jgi:hypothetical protein
VDGLDRFSVRDDVYDCGGRWGGIALGGGAVGVGAAASQLMNADGHRGQRVASPLPHSARILVADPAHHLLHPNV